MKKTFFLLAAIVLVTFQRCDNQDPVLEKVISRAQLLEDVKTWYESPLPEGVNPKIKAHGTDFHELWGVAKTQKFGKENFIVTVPVFKPNSGSSTYQLIAFYRNDEVQGFVIQVLPDKGTTVLDKNGFSGQIKIRARNGNHLKTLKFKDGKKLISNTSTFRTMDDEVAWTNDLPPVEIEGATFYPTVVYVWFDAGSLETFMENNNDDIGEEWVYSDFDSNGSTDIGLPYDPADVITVGSDDHAVPIANITEHLKCFNTNSQARLTLFVDQPVHNSSATNVGSYVGHTYITIEQGGVKRTVGFYPADNADIFDKEDDSILKDNSGKAWDMSFAFDISSDELTYVLDYIENNTSDTYNLDTYNCTNWAVDVVGSMGISLPQNEAEWPLGSGGGLCPGQLGQDLRNFTIPDRLVTKSNWWESGSAPANSGTCP